MAGRLQRLRERWAESWRSGVIGALIAAVAGLCFLIVPVGKGRTLGENLVLLSYDISLKLRPSVESSNAVLEAVIVYMDEDSHKLLNPRTGTEWHRSLHTQLLQRLHNLGARAVVFDVLMDNPWTKLAPNEPASQAAQVDEQLAAAIRQHGTVVLAGMVDVREPGPKVTQHFPTEPLRSAASGWGTVEFDVDPDRRIRRVAYSDLSDLPLPLSWKTMEVLGGHLPASRFETRWLNFYGPARTIGWKSYYQILSNDVPAAFFAGKVVFVGGAPVIGPRGVLGDYRPTPVGELPGVEIQATAFLNLWRQEWLRELSPWKQVGLISLLGLLFGFSFCLVRPGIAAVLAVVAFLLIGVSAVEMVWHRLTWFPWMITGAVQLPVALGWAVLANTRKVYREKAALEKSLATALRTPVPAAEAAPAAKAETGTVIMASPPAPHPSPTILGDHELVRIIGQGAYGEVWLARNIIGLYRAVKIIRRDRFKDDLPFQREFRGLEKFMPVSMSHPGFVKVLHIGKNEAEGFFFYIMEPADDESTGQRIDPGKYTPKNLAREYHKRGALPVLEAIDIVVPLCDALDHLHRQGLVHRDIKPSNIIFVDGVPKLADIGLVTDIARPSHNVTWVGTEGYIPPEGPGSAGADLYSLGKLLYEIALGMDPRSWPAFPTTLVQGPQQAEVLALDEVLLKACTNPLERYTSAAEFRNALQRLRGQIAGAGPTRT